MGLVAARAVGVFGGVEVQAADRQLVAIDAHGGPLSRVSVQAHDDVDRLGHRRHVVPAQDQVRGGSTVRRQQSDLRHDERAAGHGANRHGPRRRRRRRRRQGPGTGEGTGNGCGPTAAWSSAAQVAETDHAVPLRRITRKRQSLEGSNGTVGVRAERAVDGERRARQSARARGQACRMHLVQARLQRTHGGPRRASPQHGTVAAGRHGGRWRRQWRRWPGRRRARRGSRGRLQPLQRLAPPGAVAAAVDAVREVAHGDVALVVVVQPAVGAIGAGVDAVAVRDHHAGIRAQRQGCRQEGGLVEAARGVQAMAGIGLEIALDEGQLLDRREPAEGLPAGGTSPRRCWVSGMNWIRPVAWP